MPTTALVRTISAILSESKVLQMDRMLPILERDMAKVATRIFSSQTGRGNVQATTFYHREDQILPWEFTETAADSSSSATLTFLNDYIYIMEADLLRNERTGEVVLVRAYTTRDTTVDVVRGVGNTTGTTCAIGDIWTRVGTAHQEGSSAPDALMTKEVLKTFYIPFQRKSIELTTQAAKTEVYHGDDRLHQAAKKMIEMMLDYEMMLFWSAGSSDASGGAVTDYPYLSSVGLYDYLSTNTGTCTALTFGELKDFFDQMRKYHASGKFALVAGTEIHNIINDFAYDMIRVTPDTTTFGINVTTLKLGPCEVSLIEEPLWTGPYTSGVLFGLPEPIPEFLKLKTFADEGLRWKINVDTNDDKYIWKDSLTSQIGAEIWEEKKFGWLKGIVSG